MTDAAIGLREQKRLATRHALQVAMLELSIERGFDNVTVEDVAVVAQVSPRTFFNYFPSKEDAVAGDRVPFALTPEEVERFRSGRGDVLADLVAVFADQAAGEGIEVARLRKRLIQREPNLLGVRMSRMHHAGEAAAGFVADRLRADRLRQGVEVDETSISDDAGLLVMVGIAIVRHGWSRWVADGGDLAARIRAGYAEFRRLTEH